MSCLTIPTGIDQAQGHAVRRHERTHLDQTVADPPEIGLGESLKAHACAGSRSYSIRQRRLEVRSPADSSPTRRVNSTADHTRDSASMTVEPKS